MDDKEPMIEVNRRVIGEMVLELIAENKKLKKLACQRCKLTNMAFACKDGDKQCIAFTESEEK